MNWRRFLHRQRLLLVFLILVLVVYALISAFWYMENQLVDSLLTIAWVKADYMGTVAINEAIINQMAKMKVQYTDLITVHTDTEGKVQMAEVNTIALNSILAEITLVSQEALSTQCCEQFTIPLGQASGSYLLAAYGPKIPIRVYPIGKISTSVDDQFESAGINQTRHKIYLEVIATMYIAVPFGGKEIEVLATVPLVDAIYQGDVPDTVINLNLGDIAAELPFQ